MLKEGAGEYASGGEVHPDMFAHKHTDRDRRTQVTYR